MGGVSNDMKVLSVSEVGSNDNIWPNLCLSELECGRIIWASGNFKRAKTGWKFCTAQLMTGQLSSLLTT